MKITSPVFKPNTVIPLKYSGRGEDINPPLIFSEITDNTKSLALIVDDPDAVIGRWVHWTIWNINPQERGIEENDVPQGSVEGLTNFGKPGYGGPCPPSGTHRYIFKLYALDAELELQQGASVGSLEKAMQEHIIAQDELIGLFGR
jgi:Raf kinase inhibitor-like YbhB/YbcL family protein